MSTAICPLCGKPRKARAFKPLYNAMVCGRCRNSLARRRQLAFILDWVLWYVILVTAALGMSVLLVACRAQADVVETLMLASVYIVAPLILFMKDGFGGYSPGKVMCGVRVVHEATNRPIGFFESLKRNLILYVPLMPVVMAFWLVRGHRGGDGWAGTRVIWCRYAGHPIFAGTDRCKNCQYDLTGSASSVCPECGKSCQLSAVSCQP